MALDSQQKRMAVAGTVFPNGLSTSQRPVVGNVYPVSIFSSPVAAAKFIIHYLDTLYKRVFINTKTAETIYLDTHSTLPNGEDG